MKARIFTSKLSRKRIVKFLDSQGFAVQQSPEEILIEGTVEKVVYVLVELRHRYPVGYLHGWTEA